MEDKYFDVQRSLGRALINNPQLVDRFYEIFMDSHPAIRPLFSNTDFTRQTMVLRQGLNTAILYAQDYPTAERTLDQLRVIHGKDHLNIDRDLYRYWIDSLVKTVSEADHKFSPDVERQWREVLHKTVSYLAG